MRLVPDSGFSGAKNGFAHPGQVAHFDEWGNVDSETVTRTPSYGESRMSGSSLTQAQVAREVGVDPKVIYYLTKCGAIPTARLGYSERSRRRIRFEDLPKVRQVP
jgi:hypothetical protein